MSLSSLPPTPRAATGPVFRGPRQPSERKAERMPFGPTHTLLRGLAGFAFASFWHRVETHTHVDGYDGDPEKLVPDEGTPIIVVANHHNSAADVSPFLLSLSIRRKGCRAERRGGAGQQATHSDSAGCALPWMLPEHADTIAMYPPPKYESPPPPRSPSCLCTFLTTASCITGQSRPSLRPDCPKKFSSTLATCP